MIWINDRPISYNQFVNEMRWALMENTYMFKEYIPKKLKDNIIKEMVKNEILFMEAKASAIEVTNEEIDAEIKRIKQGLELEDINRLLLEEYLNYEDWVLRLKRRLIIQKLVDLKVGISPTVDPLEIEEFYRMNIEDFYLPEQIRARQLVVSTQEEASEVYRALVKGASFSSMALAKSLSPDSQKGGDLGYFSQGEMPREFEEICFSLKTGEYSKVIKSPYGYHIFQVIDRKPPRQMRLEEVKEKIRKAITNDKREAAYKRWFKEILKKYKVRLNKT